MRAFYSVADLLHRLLGLEAEHKPLPGYQPALNDVLAYLHKVWIANCSLLACRPHLLHNAVAEQ